MQRIKEETGKPLIAILMAVYEPRMDWLKQQLDSLEAQTYPNLRLYIRDDSSPTVPFGDIAACVEACVRSIPFEIRRNEENLGSNGTFELLTREAEGDYFAYCDQDDVWLPEKLAVLQEAIESEGALLVCSDMLIIDENGRQTADSITKARRHHVFRSGEGLAPGLLVTNFVTGCTMLVRAQDAREAAPFCPYMVHDHYLALWCALKGRIVSLPQPLIHYRIHTSNQTLLMAGVVDKKTYVEIRIRKLINRFTWLQERLGEENDIFRELGRRLIWAKAREAYFQGDMAAVASIWRFRNLNWKVSLFEIIFAKMPEVVFGMFIHLAQNNMI